jgi:hypothetical protein
MTSEAIKALMMSALYVALESTLFYSSIGRPAKRSARARRAETREFFSRPPED